MRAPGARGDRGLPRMRQRYRGVAMSRALLLGAGNNRKLKLGIDLQPPPETIVTLDMDVATGPDILWDLNIKPWQNWTDYPKNYDGGYWPSPGSIPDNSFEQIHAYEVLEHLGQQGNWRGFFDDFGEIYRVLKPGGYLVFSCPLPHSVWAWGDPGHTRIISLESLTFLDQENYAQVGTTPMTDYRGYWKGNLRLVGHQKTEHNLFAILQAVKP